MNANLISQKALREAAEIMHWQLGVLDDLPVELANTLANIYYRPIAYTEHLSSGGRSLFLDPYVPESSSMLDAFKNNNKFFSEAQSTFECAKDIVLSARQACSENPELFPYLVTLMLDLFKYNIENAESKTPIRRAIERKFKKVREIPNLFEIMQKAGIHDDAFYQQSRIVFDRKNRRKNWIAADNSALFSAFKIFQQLADQNYGKSYYPLSCLFRTGQDDIEDGHNYSQDYAQLAFDWCFTNQVNQDAELWSDLGEMYLYGFGVEQNYEQAVCWLRKAADQGNANAQVSLGYMYLNGYGVEQKDEQALYWFNVAAKQGNVEWQGTLGWEHYLRKNYKEAANWFRLAAENGEASAQQALRDMYDRGCGVELDHAQAKYWGCKYAEQCRKPAERGNAGAQFELGLMYGRERDDKEAMKWFRLAADQGNAKAQVRLGDIYFHGLGVEQNDAQAVNWYLMAAKQGDREGRRGLGMLGMRANEIDNLIARRVERTKDDGLDTL